MPSQRFRVEHYINLQSNPTIEFHLHSFYTTKSWSYLHKRGYFFNKLMGVSNGFIRRLRSLCVIAQYDFVYIHREAASVGPPIIEWLIAKIFRKKIIYDFDDSIWVNVSSEVNPIAKHIRCSWKVKHICNWSNKVSAGNEYLASYARQYCKDVRILPTVVDTNDKHNKVKVINGTPLTIGWTGTFTNFVQLDIIIPVIKKLQQKYAFNFLIIADKDPQYKNVTYTFKQWDVNTEIEDLLQLDIGLMPLGNTILELGKCAFKAIQYMSLGIPAVVSGIGCNKEVVTDGFNGYWADSLDEWYKKIETLINNPTLREEFGKNARNKIVAQYSVDATKEDFFRLFQ